jgi:hypothetical protein
MKLFAIGIVAALIVVCGGALSPIASSPDAAEETSSDTAPPPDGGFDDIVLLDGGVDTITPLPCTPTPEAGTGGCNDLPLCGPKVEIYLVGQALPAPQGGRIADGLYWLTDFTGLNGVGGASASAPFIKSRKIGAATVAPCSFGPKVRGLSKPT